MSVDEEFRISFSCLKRGELYPIQKVERTESKFHGKVTKGVKVYFLDEELELVTYLPKKLVESTTDQDVDRINKAGATDKKDNLCYYGKQEGREVTSFIGRIHPYGEGEN